MYKSSQRLEGAGPRFELLADVGDLQFAADATEALDGARAAEGGVANECGGLVVPQGESGEVDELVARGAADRLTEYPVGDGFAVAARAGATEDDCNAKV